MSGGVQTEAGGAVTGGAKATPSGSGADASAPATDAAAAAGPAAAAGVPVAPQASTPPGSPGAPTGAGAGTAKAHATAVGAAAGAAEGAGSGATDTRLPAARAPSQRAGPKPRMLAHTTNRSAASTVMPVPYPNPGLIRCAETTTSTYTTICATGMNVSSTSHGLKPPHLSRVAVLRNGTHAFHGSSPILRNIAETASAVQTYRATESTKLSSPSRAARDASGVFMRCAARHRPARGSPSRCRTGSR